VAGVGRARHLSASASARALAVALIAVFATGCGSSGSGMSSDERPEGHRAPPGALARTCTGPMRGMGELRVTGMPCSVAAGIAGSWMANGRCAMPASASRGSCAIGRYRCLAAATERGLAVSCARPGRSISFIATRS
jgi:hypothetical protein